MSALCLTMEAFCWCSSKNLPALMAVVSANCCKVLKSLGESIGVDSVGPIDFGVRFENIPNLVFKRVILVLGFALKFNGDICPILAGTNHNHCFWRVHANTIYI